MRIVQVLCPYVILYSYKKNFGVKSHVAGGFYFEKIFYFVLFYLLLLINSPNRFSIDIYV